jgi:hypothetical protein
MKHVASPLRVGEPSVYDIFILYSADYAIIFTEFFSCGRETSILLD